MGYKIGCDMGKSAFKLACDGEKMGSDGKYEVLTCELPSYRSSGKLKTLVSGTGFESLQVRYDGEDYLLDKSALLGKSFSWPMGSDKATLHNLVLLLGALGKIGKHSADIVLGLPAGQMSNSSIINSIHQLFDGEKHATINGVDFTFNIRTKIISEPIGTYYSLVFEQEKDGSVHLQKKDKCPYFDKHIAIVDIGYRTIDIIDVKGGQLGTFNDSSLSGMVDIVEQANQILTAKYGMIAGNEKVKVYNAIAAHAGESFSINDKEIDKRFWDEIASFKKQRARIILEEVKGALASVKTDLIVITGGGAMLLEKELKAIDGNLLIHKNARFANAIGFYYLAKTFPWKQQISNTPAMMAGR